MVFLKRSQNILFFFFFVCYFWTHVPLICSIPYIILIQYISSCGGYIIGLYSFLWLVSWRYYNKKFLHFLNMSSFFLWRRLTICLKVFILSVLSLQKHSNIKKKNHFDTKVIDGSVFIYCWRNKNDERKTEIKWYFSHLCILMKN